MGAKPKSSKREVQNKKPSLGAIPVTCSAADVVALDDFQPLQGEFKTLSPEDKERLKTSIKTHGISFPFFAWREPRTDVIYIMDAHQRRLALIELREEGYEIPKIPTAWIDAKDKREALKKLLAVASQYGKVNARGLYDVLSQAKLDIDTAMASLRFPEIDMKAIKVEFFNNPDKEKIQDEIPAVVKPVCKPGQLWILGEHRLLCGDSQNPEHVARLLDGQAPVLMVTDPPYGVNYDPTWRDKVVTQIGKARTGKVANDDQADWTDAWRLSNAQIAYVWHASCFTDVVMKSLRDADFDVRQMIIWNKDVAPMGRSAYHWKHEPCWYAVKRGKDANWVGDRKQKTVWDGPSPTQIFGKKDAGDKEKTLHPTQKPLFVYEIPINNHTRPGDLMYDAFGGSGSAIIAAEKHKRRCAVMELDPKYADVIIARWEKYSGQKAKLSK